MQQVHTFLADTANRALPRILTQICRDPDSHCYGACDRDWWHYKIRDFPSIILQQAGYTLALAAEYGWRSRSRSSWGMLPQTVAGASSPRQSSVRQLAAATARFWNHRALKHGAFEEYYPYEQGYPPTAFATLASAKLTHMDIISTDEILPGLAVAARQLLSRFEARAANQQIAGTAALAVIRSIAPRLVPESGLQEILARVLALQHDEGWFPEYDGPDLGYLSVSIDCLYDIHDHTADPRILPAIRKAAHFIRWFVLSPAGGAGMHNSRNTDYITPYGLVRLALEERDPLIVATVAKVFSRQAGSDQSSSSAHSFHPFDAVDDRYWCHYIGHSVFRAVLLLQNLGWDSRSQPVAGTNSPRQTTETPDHRPPIASRTGSGHALLTSAAGATALVSTRKGGVLTAVWPDGSSASDFGWLIQTPDNLLVTHWWSTAWEIDISDHAALTKGWLVAHKEQASTPWKHGLLRIASFLLGHRLIGVLKRLVIFKKPLRSHHLTRRITWEGETLVITDTISGVSADTPVTRAPRASKRHVASADSYHPQDFALLDGIDRHEWSERKDGIFTHESRFRVTGTEDRKEP